MAKMSIITGKGDATVTPPPANSFQISSGVADRCERIFKKVDSIAYFTVDSGTGGEISPGAGKAAAPAPPEPTTGWAVGDLIYSDVGLTVLYNEGLQRDFNINEGSFITLDKGSTVVNTTCK